MVKANKIIEGDPEDEKEEDPRGSSPNGRSPKVTDEVTQEYYEKGKGVSRNQELQERTSQDTSRHPLAHSYSSPLPSPLLPEHPRPQVFLQSSALYSKSALRFLVRWRKTP